MQPDEHDTDEERDVVASAPPILDTDSDNLDAEELEKRLAGQINLMNNNVNEINEKIDYLEELIEISLTEQNITQSDQKKIQMKKIQLESIKKSVQNNLTDIIEPD